MILFLWIYAKPSAIPWACLMVSLQFLSCYFDEQLMPSRPKGIYWCIHTLFRLLPMREQATRDICSEILRRNNIPLSRQCSHVAIFLHFAILWQMPIPFYETKRFRCTDCVSHLYILWAIHKMLIFLNSNLQVVAVRGLEVCRKHCSSRAFTSSLMFIIMDIL